MSATNNLDRDELAPGQEDNQYVTVNDSDGVLDARITDDNTLLISTTTPVVGTVATVGQNALLRLVNHGTPPAADFTVRFPATDLGLIEIKNETSFIATLEISGQSSPPTLAAGARGIFSITAADGVIASAGAALGVNAEAYTIATLPTATAGKIIRISDAGGGITGAMGDGSRWRRFTEEGMQTNNTDADFTLTPITDAPTVEFTPVMAANRAVTLSTTRAYDGIAFNIYRPVTSTGEFYLDVGGLCKLYRGQWCRVVYDGSAWKLARFGSQHIDIPVQFVGTPTASQRLLMMRIATPMFLPASLVGSTGRIFGTQPSADTDFSIEQNGTPVGYVRFSNGSNDPTFSLASQADLAINNRFEILAPAALNGIVDFGFTLKGYRELL